MTIRAYLASLPDGAVSIIYVDEVRGTKREITEPFQGQDIADVQAVARARAAILSSNADAVEKLKAYIGQEIDLQPAAAEVSPEVAAKLAFIASRFKYQQTKREFADDLATQEEVDAAKAEMQKLYNRDLYRDSL